MSSTQESPATQTAAASEEKHVDVAKPVEVPTPAVAETKTAPAGEDSDAADLANSFKDAGNKAFAQNKFLTAIELYTKAIDANPNDAVFWANRAFCHVKLEEYGSALEDASKAIELNRRYVKGYYRRGTANFAMGKYRAALTDFQQVVKIAPKDADAKKKVAACQKAIYEAAFAKAIEGEKKVPVSQTVDWESMEVESSYEGPHMPWPLTPDFIDELIAHFQAQKTLHRKYVYRILLEVIKLLSSLPTLVEIPVPEGTHITVCGDVHGQFYDLLNIWKLNGKPSLQNPYLFNGDFVDRGSFSYEIIVTFFALKLLYPDHFHLMRGNHESITMNQIYGFRGEVIHKCDAGVFDLFSEAFNWLPLAAVLNKKVLIVHGGLFSEDGVTLDDIKNIDRNMQPPDKGLMCEILWSDPQPQNGRAPSKRGVGLSFGPDITRRFLEHNKLELIVRSHEVKEEGYQVEADGQLITIFSAPNYCDSMGNKGAFIRFESDLKPQFTSFSAVPHPPVAPMAYATPMFRG